MTLALTLVVVHFIGDFVCQSDWMAMHKSKRWDALALHVVVYTGVLGLGISFTQPPSPYPYSTLWTFGLFILVNGALHFLTDAVTSRVNSRFWFFKREDGIWQQAEYTQPKHGRTLVNP